MSPVVAPRAPVPMNSDVIATWNLGKLYGGPNSSEFKQDLLAAHQGIKTLRGLAGEFEAAANGSLQERSPDEELSSLFGECDTIRCKVEALLADLHVYCMALINTGEDAESSKAASGMLRRVSALIAELTLITKAMQAAIVSFEDLDFGRLVGSLATPGSERYWRQERNEQRLAASLAEERTISLLGSEAYKAWADLYQRLSAELVVPLPNADGGTEQLAVTDAITAIDSPDANRRRLAWDAIHRAWEPHETAVAAIINSLTSYRLKLQTIRNRSGSDILAPSLSENRLSRDVLDQMMEAVERNRPRLHRAVRVMARLLGKQQLDPWDLGAACVDSEIAETFISLPDAFALIEASFAELDPAMGEFVARAQRERWIDARPPGKGRHLGDFQTSVRRGRHPLVFVNYGGSRRDVMTLAHELAHAYHFWLLRDEPAIHHRLPPTLAESVSTLAEFVVGERWFSINPTSAVERRHLAWNECQMITLQLLVMPTSFTFEHQIHVDRRKGALSARDLAQTMGQSWARWFGSTLTRPDSGAWIRKPYFASTRNFYSYPYMFGMLIAGLLRDARERRPAGFPGLFTAFLRDCAQLDVVDVLNRHFPDRNAAPGFWEAALDILDLRIARAEELADFTGACST